MRQIPHGEPVQNHHDINIAVFMSFTAQPASLQPNIQQTLSESRPAVQNQISQVFVQIKHLYFTPQVAIKCRLNASIFLIASSVFSGSRSHR